MTTEARFIDHICSQAGLGAALTSKRMFGEYALYLDGKVVAFACDNQLYVKPTPEGRALLGDDLAEAPPYPNARPHYRLDGEIEDRALLQQLLRVTAQALPTPKPKAPKRRSSSKAVAASRR